MEAQREVILGSEVLRYLFCHKCIHRRRDYGLIMILKYSGFHSIDLISEKVMRKVDVIGLGYEQPSDLGNSRQGKPK